MSSTETLQPPSPRLCLEMEKMKAQDSLEGSPLLGIHPLHFQGFLHLQIASHEQEIIIFFCVCEIFLFALAFLNNYFKL